MVARAITIAKVFLPVARSLYEVVVLAVDVSLGEETLEGHQGGPILSSIATLGVQ